MLAGGVGPKGLVFPALAAGFVFGRGRTSVPVMLGEADVLAASVDLLGGSCRSRRRGTTEVHAFHGVLLLLLEKTTMSRGNFSRRLNNYTKGKKKQIYFFNKYFFVFIFENAHIRLLADCYTRVVRLRNVFKNKKL